MTRHQAANADFREITALFDQLGEAHASHDADAIVAAYASDAVVFSLAPPLGERGIDRDDIAAWLKTWDGPVRVDARDVDLTISDGVAFSTALNRMSGRKTDGEEVDMWFRTTMCLKKMDGRWCIVHDHSSVPFYMDGSYRACTDLKPE